MVSAKNDTHYDDSSGNCHPMEGSPDLERLYIKVFVGSHLNQGHTPTYQEKTVKVGDEPQMNRITVTTGQREVNQS